MIPATKNYLNKIGYFFLFILITFFLAGCKIEGNVSEQGQGVKDVTVNLTGTETSTTLTRDNGYFKFKYLDKGEYTVSLSKTGYTFEPVSQKVAIESRFDVKTISFEAISNKIPIADPQNITLDEDSSTSIVLTGSDQDNDPLTFTVRTNPEHGQLTGTAPDLIYTPSENFNGTDSFTFAANDGNNNSAPAVINIEITPVNDPPVANDDMFTAEYSTTEYTTGNVLINDSDIDGDSLTVLSFTQPDPSNGIVTDNGDGTFTFSANASFKGETSFTYTVSDGNNGTDTATVTLRIPPSVNISASPVSINKGEQSTLTWTSSNADTCTIEPNIGNVDLNGSLNITPQETTTYTITALNADGSATSSIDITVKTPPTGSYYEYDENGRTIKIIRVK